MFTEPVFRSKINAEIPNIHVVKAYVNPLSVLTLAVQAVDQVSISIENKVKSELLEVLPKVIRTLTLL